MDFCCVVGRHCNGGNKLEKSYSLYVLERAVSFFERNLNIIVVYNGI